MAAYDPASRFLQPPAVVLAAAARDRDWRSIPWLLQYLAQDDAGLRRTAVSVIDTLVASTPTSALPGLDFLVRESTWYTYHWDAIEHQWVVAQQWPPYIWALFTMHTSGYVREAALRRLVDEQPAAIALPFVLLRINDWVDQVRTPAIQAAKALLLPTHAGLWLSLIGLVNQVSRRKRADHAWLTDALTSVLIDPGSRDVLTAALASPDRTAARFAFRAAMQLPESDRAAYIHLALGSEDPLVRLQAAKAVCAWKGCPDRERWLLAMTRDRVMPIRRQALYAALDAPAERRRAALNAALLDRHASVRHAARFYLRNDTAAANHQTDFRSFYLSAIAHVNPSTRAAAVLGLGECGTPSDAATLASLVAQESAPVAAAAVRAVGALNRDQSLDWFVDLLRDHRPAVSREAARALAPVAQATPGERLRRILQDHECEHCRRAALRVLLRRDPHDAMVDALTAIQTAEPALVRAGTTFIRAAKPWRSANGPSPTQQATVRAMIISMAPPLPDDLRRSVCEMMGIVDG